MFNLQYIPCGVHCASSASAFGAGSLRKLLVRSAQGGVWCHSSGAQACAAHEQLPSSGLCGGMLDKRPFVDRAAGHRASIGPATRAPRRAIKLAPWICRRVQTLRVCLSRRHLHAVWAGLEGRTRHATFLGAKAATVCTLWGCMLLWVRPGTCAIGAPCRSSTRFGPKSERGAGPKDDCGDPFRSRPTGAGPPGSTRAKFEEPLRPLERTHRSAFHARSTRGLRAVLRAVPSLRSAFRVGCGAKVARAASRSQVGTSVVMQAGVSTCRCLELRVARLCLAAMHRSEPAAPERRSTATGAAGYP